MLIVTAGKADDELVTVSDQTSSQLPFTKQTLECVEMEKHEPGSGTGGGEDPSLIQLTTADGKCVLLYTVTTTHCTHYCDSDTCL